MQPQSDDDIRWVIEELQRLDHLLDVRWNEKAVIVKRGDYSVLGKNTPHEYDGLWEVIRYETPGLTDRPFVVLFQVTQPVRVGRRQILMMESKGPYAPIESWLIEYMQTWDAAQRCFAESMNEAWRAHEEAENLDAIINDRAAHQEAAEKVYAEHAGPYWMGGAQGRAHPETVQLLYGKRKKSSTAGAISS